MFPGLYATPLRGETGSWADRFIGSRSPSPQVEPRPKTDLPGEGHKTINCPSNRPRFFGYSAVMAAVDTPRRILIIRPSALGDVVRTVPALVSLRAQWPQARIDWLVQDTYAEVVRHHPALSGVVPFPRQALARWFINPAGAVQFAGLCARLNSSRYDLVIDLQGLLRSGFFTLVTGAHRRVGFANARELGWLGYNRRHRISRGVHTVDRMLGLLAAEGIPLAPDLQLYPGPQDAQWAQTFLAGHALADQPFAIVAPTAQWLCKCWPLDRFAAIIDRLLRTGLAGGRVIVLAAPHEQEYVRLLRTLLPGAAAAGREGPKAGSLLFPSTTPGQMLALIARCALLVCNDSAALHMAVGFDKPIAAVFGPTDPALVGPYHRPDAVIQPPDIRPADILNYRHREKDQTLISRIPVEAVWQRIEALMSARGGMPA